VCLRSYLASWDRLARVLFLPLFSSFAQCRAHLPTHACALSHSLTRPCACLVAVFTHALTLVRSVIHSRVRLPRGCAHSATHSRLRTQSLTCACSFLARVLASFARLVGSSRVCSPRLLASSGRLLSNNAALSHSSERYTRVLASFVFPLGIASSVLASFACIDFSLLLVLAYIVLRVALFCSHRLLTLLQSRTHSPTHARIVFSSREIASSLSYNDFLPCEIDSSAVCLVCLHRLFTLCRTYSITHSLTYSLICVLSSCSCLACSPREIVLSVLAYIVLRVALFCLHRLLPLLQCRTHSPTHARIS